jgi:hypothetical protein
MGHVRFLARLRRLEEKGMVVRKPLPMVNVEEACDWLVISVNKVGRREPNDLGVPVEHHLVVAFWICHSIVAPSIDGRRAGLKTLESSNTWLLVFVIYNELFEVHRFLLLLRLAVYEVNFVTGGVSERQDLAAARGFQT